MTPAPVVRTPSELRAMVGRARAAGAGVALIPTMGALHLGHLSLVQIAGSRCDFVIASLFVNPTQFAPGEDFQAYPRDEPRDVAMLSAAGCHGVYAPAVEAIYPQGFSTSITVSGVSAPLEGAFRPSHFPGVATVVAKLLIQARPDVAVFGEKDYQQLQVIRRLVIDLDLEVEILAAPIVRDADGLALSSRNAYLTEHQRRTAPELHRSLTWAANELASGAAVQEVETHASSRLLELGFDGVDYFEARGPQNLERLGPGPLMGPARLLTAAWLGRTRLIDNLTCPLPGA